MFSQQVTAAALPIVGAEVSFGVLPGDADYLDVYVDQSASGPAGGRVIWRIYANIGGPSPVLLAQSLPTAPQAAGALPFAPIEMIAGTSYELRGIAADIPITVPVKGGFAASDAQVDTQPPLDVVSGSAALPINNAAISFAAIPRYHTQFLATVSANGQQNTASTWRLLGTIAGVGGIITAQIAIGSFAQNPSGGALSYIVFNTSDGNEATNVGHGLGTPTRCRAAGAYALFGNAQDPAGTTGPVLASLVGYDLNLDIQSATDVSYTPAVLADWSGTAPTSVANALDRIAAKITPIP